jgi:threonine aldolase
MNAIIEQAKSLYPMSFYYTYKGGLTLEQCSEIAQQCEIHRLDVYMDGTRLYRIRYKAGDEV